MKPPTVESMARILAALHGSAFTIHRNGEQQTVASDHGFGRWGHSPGQYADKHWQRYRGAAEYVMRLLTVDDANERTCEVIGKLKSLQDDQYREPSERPTAEQVADLADDVIVELRLLLREMSALKANVPTVSEG